MNLQNNIWNTALLCLWFEIIRKEGQRRTYVVTFESSSFSCYRIDLVNMAYWFNYENMKVLFSY